MSFTSAYRIGFYLMLIAATLVLSIDAVDSPIAMLYPVAVAAAAVIAHFTVDRNPALGLSRSACNALALVACGLAYLEFHLDDKLLLLALGHWLVYLQLVYMFREKTVETDWYMFTLGVVQVMVGTVVSQADSVGMMLFLWAVLSLWVLGLFSLQRDAVRARGAAELPGAAEVAGAAPAGAEPYPGLLDLPFILSALRLTVTTMALGGVIFLAMPRENRAARSLRGDTRAQHITGFDEEVQLGQMGEILENDSIVMSVEFYDEAGNRIAPEGEPLWRGVTMAIYENGRWLRQLPDIYNSAPHRPDPAIPQGPGRPVGLIRQVVKLEANDSNAVFALRPVYEASGSRRVGVEINRTDGALVRTDVRGGSFDYQVSSYRDSLIPQPGERPPGPHRRRISLMGVPDGPRQRLESTARKVLAEKLPAPRHNDARAVAETLEAYLRDSGEFAYTLRQDVVDPSLDPVEDFLVNRKEGHCEYFASTLALMLRSVGIPTRLVNGFKGGDWSDLAKVMSVRQKHAHSWVEAYLGETGGNDSAPIWLTLDPTPGNEREAAVSRVSGFRGSFRPLSDAIRYFWVFYVVGYNQERQQRLLYGPIRSLFEEAKRGFRLLRDWFERARERVVEWLDFPDARSLISIRGFVVAFSALLLLVGAYRFLRWLVGRLLRIVRGHVDEAESMLAGAAHYRRLTQLLAPHGLERAPAETQEEFARRAMRFLSDRGSATIAEAAVPQVVVDAFYRVRFGQRELSVAAAEGLDARLDALERSLRTGEDGG